MIADSRLRCGSYPDGRQQLLSDFSHGLLASQETGAATRDVIDRCGHPRAVSGSGLSRGFAGRVRSCLYRGAS